LGFNDFYDWGFDTVTDMKRVKLPFTFNDKDLIFWGWAGDYVNLGAGAEVGIYTDTTEVFGQTIDLGEHYFVDKDYMIRMKLNLDYKNGDNIFRYAPTDPQWWITGFNPSYKSPTFTEKDLYATAEIDFSERPDWWEAFFEEYKKRGEYDIRIYSKEYKVVLKW
jgi:hypothetical protein